MLEVLRLLMKNRTRNYGWNFEMACINIRRTFKLKSIIYTFTLQSIQYFS